MTDKKKSPKVHVYARVSAYSKGPSGKEEFHHMESKNGKVLADIHGQTTEKRKTFSIEDKKQKKHFTMSKEEVHKIIAQRSLNSVFIQPFPVASMIQKAG